MLHGRVFGRVLQYGVGLFNDDGEVPPGLEAVEPLPDEPAPPQEGRTWAARATVAPLRLTSMPGKYNKLEVGGAFTSGTVPEGRNHLQGKTVFGGRSSIRQYYTNGPRKRFGLELSWAIGPASIAAEYIVAQEAREGQGAGNEGQVDNDLPEIEGRGWYIAGTWVVTGENRDGGVKVKRPAASRRLRRHRGGRALRATALRQRRLAAGTAIEEPAGGDHRRQRRPRVDTRRELVRESLGEDPVQRHQRAARRPRAGARAGCPVDVDDGDAIRHRLLTAPPGRGRTRSAASRGAPCSAVDASPLCCC